MTSDTLPAHAPRPWYWAAACYTAIAVMIADANLGLLAEPWRSLLKVLVVALWILTMVSARRKAKLEGPASPALRTFQFRTMAAGAGCILTFGVAASVYGRLPHGSPLLWPLALVTAVPLLGAIWAMGRYLTEETDEYLRHLAIMSALIGLGAVLVTATVWGFLENLGLVPHIWGWYLVPFFAVAREIGLAWLKARNQ